MVQTEADFATLVTQAKQCRYLVLQDYQHVMRAYKPVTCLQAVQIGDTIFVVDSLRFGLLTEVSEAAQVLKISGKVYEAETRNILEVHSTCLQENLQ